MAQLNEISGHDTKEKFLPRASNDKKGFQSFQLAELLILFLLVIKIVTLLLLAYLF